LNVVERDASAEPRWTRYSVRRLFARFRRVVELEVPDEALVELASSVDVPVVAALVGDELVG
jgi:hypothetical protein